MHCTQLKPLFEAEIVNWVRCIRVECRMQRTVERQVGHAIQLFNRASHSSALAPKLICTPMTLLALCTRN
ncbi:MAG: hypothetical protein AAF702_27440 [Chloroflexota bacterium]